MYCEIELANGRPDEELHECFKSDLRTIRSRLSALKLDDFDCPGPKSNVIRRAVSPVLSSRGWNRDVLVAPSITRVGPKRNYLLDGVHLLAKPSCPGAHRLAIEVCFDNRQAVGTNLLKFELASHFDQRGSVARNRRLFLGLIIAGDREFLNTLGWDPAVASADEYEIALRSAYGEVLEARIALATLRM